MLPRAVLHCIHSAPYSLISSSSTSNTSVAPPGIFGAAHDVAAAVSCWAARASHDAAVQQPLTRARVAVPHAGRDGQLAALADAHADQALVPALDHHACRSAPQCRV